MLTRLREFLQTNFVEFRICVNVVRIELFKFDEKINFTNDFFDVHDCAFDEIIDKWKTIILKNAFVFRSIDEIIAQKHIQKNETYDVTIFKILFELIRSLLKKNSYAIQIKKK